MPKNLLRSVVLVGATLAAAAVLLPGLALAAPTAGATPSLASLQTGVLADLNQIRVAHHLVPLKLNAQLSAAAAQHTHEMIADGYFAHESADGSAFWKRIQRFYPSTHYGYWTVGENLLWSGAPLDAQGAMSMWMASPEHRANILTARWREIGISALSSSNASGPYAGYDVTLVATDFGARN